MGFAAGYMPFEMIDKTTGSRQRFLIPSDPRRGGQEAHFIGFDLDLARAMANELGVRLQPVNTRFTDLFQTLSAGRIDLIISGMSVTPERARLVDFSDPYMTIGQTVIINSKHQDSVRSYRDLNTARFVVIAPPGTTAAAAVEKFLPKATYSAVESEAEALAAVRHGVADAFVYDSPHNAIAFAMDKSGKLELLDQPFTEEQLGIAIRKDETQLLAWINAFLDRLENEGQRERMMKKWFQNTGWYWKVR